MATSRQHVVCVRRRRIRDIEIEGLERVLGEKTSLDGFETLGSSLEIRALCEISPNDRRGLIAA